MLVANSSDSEAVTLAAGRQAHADPPRDVRPDRPAADARGGRGVREGRLARRLREAGRPLARLARTTASAGGGTGSTSPATPTPRATSSSRGRSTRGRGPTAITSSARSTTTCRYDRFVLEQLAADLLCPGDDRDGAGRARVPDGRPALHEQHARHHRRPDRRRDARADGPDGHLRPLPRPQVRPDPAGRLLLALRRLPQFDRADRPAAGRPAADAPATSALRRRAGRSARRSSSIS